MRSINRFQIFQIFTVQKQCEGRGGRPRDPSLIVLIVSVNVKQH